MLVAVTVQLDATVAVTWKLALCGEGPAKALPARAVPHRARNRRVLVMVVWSRGNGRNAECRAVGRCHHWTCNAVGAKQIGRSEEHTSELQSRENLVCRLLL